VRAAVVSAAAVIAVLVLGGASARALRLPAAPRCPVFPATSAWNERVDSLPVAPDSAQLVASIGLDSGLHADFGSGVWDGGPIGIPFDVVSAATPRSRVTFEYADESDRVRYPIPRTVHIEGGRGSSGDRHAVLVDRDACTLYELYALYPQSGGGWHAGSGAVWSLRSNRLRPAGWTSADAAGLPIFPGLARYDEVARGVIDHALRFTAPRTRRAVDVSGFPPQARVVLTALERYGMILADDGSSWYVSGAPDPRWSNAELHTLGRVTGADLEVVDTSSLPHPGA
jgi:hypothetical protein